MTASRLFAILRLMEKSKVVKKIRLSTWAKKVKVSPQRAYQWFKDGRIKACYIADRVLMIQDDYPRPKRERPYGLIKKEFSEFM